MHPKIEADLHGYREGRRLRGPTYMGAGPSGLLDLVEVCLPVVAALLLSIWYTVHLDCRRYHQSGTMASLQLFPSTTNTSQPRKSSMKKTRPAHTAVAPGELKRSTILVQSAPNAPAQVLQPAKTTIQHSLFCGLQPSDQASRGIPRKRRLDLQRTSSSARSPVPSASPGSETCLSSKEDRPSELLVNTYFGTGWPTKCHLQRPTVQPDTNDALVSPGGDTISPLPTKPSFTPNSARRTEHPATHSKRSSYSLHESSTTRSIFPQYDPSRPLQQQQYCPSFVSPTPRLQTEKFGKLGTSPERPGTSASVDSAVVLVEGYEHIPSADSDDLMAIWNASCGSFPGPGRKVHTSLFRVYGKATLLAIGNSQEELVYSMRKEEVLLNQFTIRKHVPQAGRIAPTPVAQLRIPDPAESIEERENDVITIFPQVAAIKAIEDVANTPMAVSTATFDHTAKFFEAATLANGAVSQAHTMHRCELVRNTRSAVTASYRLEHPSLSTFAVTVSRSTLGQHSRDPRAKVSIHHPSATPAAVAAETLVLAFLDLARDACVIDIPGLLALNDSYILDTMICALLAVAVMENDALMAEAPTFAAPPQSALLLQKSKTSSSHCGVSLKASKNSSSWLKKNKKAKRQVQEEQVDIPALTEGALAILGLSFKTAISVLEAGVKVAAAGLIGVLHVAKKL